MFSFGFLQPWLALAAAPIGAAVVFVHLLRPGRHRPVRWAAMQFLQAAVAESHRRLRLERWLLLLLRTVLLVLLALMLARPVQRRLSGLFAGSDARAVLIVVDNGLAMQARSTVAPHTLMEEAIKAAAPAVLSAADPVAILPAVGDARVGWLSRGESAEAALKQVPATAGRADWPSLLARARQALPASGVAASRRTVLLLTSLTAGNWPDIDQLAQPLADLRGASGRVVLVDVQPAARDNLAITDLAVESAFAGRDLPARAVASVVNYGAVASPSVKIAWSVDGREVRQDDVGPIPPGSPKSLAADVPAFAAGGHNVQVHLVGPADALAADDQRWFAIAMPKSLRIVLVEPESAAPAGSRASLFVAAALASAAQQGSVPIVVETITPAQLSSAFFEPADAVLLCDVPGLAAADWQQLDEQVDRGCGLLAWCGPRSMLQPNAAHSKGLLSVLAQAADIRRTDADGAIRLAEPVRPALLDLAQESATGDAALGSAARLLRIQPPADAQVMARTAAGDPLVLLRRGLHSGSILVATAPDLSWTSMPSRPAFPAFVLAMLREVLPAPDPDLQVTCGRPIRLPLPPAASTGQSRWIRPDGSAEPAQVSLDAGRFDAVLPLAAQPGTYQLETTAGSRTVFANADPKAGNLAPLPEAARRSLSEAGVSLVAAGDLSQAVAATASDDLSGPLAGVLLAILLAELLLTAWFTRARQA